MDNIPWISSFQTRQTQNKIDFCPKPLKASRRSLQCSTVFCRGRRTELTNHVSWLSPEAKPRKTSEEEDMKRWVIILQKTKKFQHFSNSIKDLYVNLTLERPTCLIKRRKCVYIWNHNVLGPFSKIEGSPYRPKVDELYGWSNISTM